MALKFGKSLREKSDILIASVTQADETEAWKVFEKYHDHDYSYTDCSSFVFMKRSGIKKVIALDEDFVEMGFQVIP